MCGLFIESLDMYISLLILSARYLLTSGNPELDVKFNMMVTKIQEVRDLTPAFIISENGKEINPNLERDIKKVIKNYLPGIFQEYVSIYGRHYSPKVSKKRYRLFLKNFRSDFIGEGFNKLSESSPYERGLNIFSDLSDSERIQYLGYNRSTSVQPPESDNEVLMPMASGAAFGWPVYPKSDVVDWRKRSASRPPRNQHKCAVCWAFSSVILLESLYFLKTGVLQDLSVQQVVDCTHRNKFGCVGGWYADAWTYVKSIGRLSSEYDYPLSLREDSRCFDYSGRSYANAMPAVWIGTSSMAYDEADVLRAVSMHPVAAGLHVRRSLFVYKSGIFVESSDCPSSIETNNHAIIIVGYTPEYYIMKNSWGLGWGERGYFRMERGANCGLYTDVQWPNLHTISNRDPRSPELVCEDKSAWCKWFGVKSCSASTWFREKCGYTCSVCSCRDIINNCWEKVSLCKSDSKVQINCKRSCGLCYCPPGTTLCRTRCVPYWSKDYQYSKCSKPIPSKDFHED